MSKSLNKVTLLGRLGKDPEIRYTTNGKAVTTFDVRRAATIGLTRRDKRMKRKRSGVAASRGNVSEKSPENICRKASKSISKANCKRGHGKMTKA